MALSSRLAVSGRISGIIQPDIRYYPAIEQDKDIQYHLAGYPVRQLARYPDSALKKLQDVRYPVLVQSAGYPVIRQNHYLVHPYWSRFFKTAGVGVVFFKTAGVGVGFFKTAGVGVGFSKLLELESGVGTFVY